MLKNLIMPLSPLCRSEMQSQGAIPLNPCRIINQDTKNQLEPSKSNYSDYPFC